MDTSVKIFGMGLRTRTQRRLLVVADYASYGMVLGSFWLAHTVKKELMLLAIPAFLLWGACFWALSQLTRMYSFSSGKQCVVPDERETQVRDRGFAHSYMILSLMVSLAIVYDMLAHDFGWWLPAAGQLQNVLWVVLMFVSTLPSAVLAWELPDVRDDYADLSPDGNGADLAHAARP